VQLTKLKALGPSLARASSKALGGAQQCPEMLQLTYETNLIQVSPNLTTPKLYMTSPIASCEAESSCSKQSIIQKPNLIGCATGKTGLSFGSMYRKLYIADRCHMKSRSKGAQSKKLGEKSITEECQKLINP
jgi:hypothetical protein